ncbi:DnaJ C-terminal domain-containing protein [Paracoccaceae bacterium Fryx2]|nr:DnaJ C-terminal domain-containing protein [Paracoccaceae bacterium Fryx2]
MTFHTDRAQMSNDPYAALGLKKTATADDIKKAYRKLVRSSHPDLHPDDKAAEARFKAISAAHDLLKDPATRARFDAGEIDATGAEKPDRRFYRDYAGAQGGPQGAQRRGFEGYGDPSDIFAEILRQRAQSGADPRQGFGGQGFGGQGFAADGPDLRFALEVPFLDAVRGAKTRITLPDGGPMEVQIPQGTADGQTLRLRGKGAPGHGGGKPGDALVTVTLRPHPVFQRDGDDIVMVLPITFDEAVLGGKVTTPTIDGPVSLTIPRGASSGRVMRLRGRGVKRPGAEPGDQRVELRIMAPPQPDPALAAFLEDWRKTHSYDPRAGVFDGMPT